MSWLRETQNEWIPCDKAMPYDDGISDSVLVTYEAEGKRGRKVLYFSLEEDPDDSGWYCPDTHYPLPEGEEVIAWIPIPLPYDKEAER